MRLIDTVVSIRSYYTSPDIIEQLLVSNEIDTNEINTKNTRP